MKFFKRKNSTSHGEQKTSRLQKWITRLGVVAIAIASILLPSKQAVFAASIYKNYVGVYYNGTVAGMVTYNGTPAYCIQMETHMPKPWGSNGQSGNVYSTTPTEAYSGLSGDLKQRISAITYYGYGYGGRNSIVYYYAAQQAIWDLQGYPNISWSGSVSTSSVQAAKNEILADVNNYLNNSGRQASFVIKDSSGNTVGSAGADSYFDRAVIGKTYTITDTNGYLASSTVTRNDFGSRAKINGNTITVTMDESDYQAKHAITVQTGSAALPQRGEGVVLYAGSYQNLITVSTPSASANSATVVLQGYGVPVEFTKKNENGQALAGAELSLYKVNSDNSEILIESYTSTGSAKHFDLCPGNYKMVEIKAPKGYYKSKPVTFTVKKTPDVVQKFEMSDTPIKLKIAKLGASSNTPVIGAVLRFADQLTNADLDTWTTDENDHIIDSSKLEAGHLYFLYEDYAPPGYFKLKNRVLIQIPEYTPDDADLTDGYLVEDVVDEEIDYRALKLDADTNEYVVGATMVVYDADKNVIDQWVTDGTYHKIDKTKLEAGKTYTVHELKAPEGYYVMPKDETFTVDFDIRGQYEVKCYDTKVKSGILKTDDEGGAIEGALLSLKDSTGKVIDQFRSTLGAHTLEGLADGATYTIEELEAPKGYYRTSTPKEFTVKATSATAQAEDQIINFENPLIEYYVQKVDKRKKDKLLAGAILQIIDDETNTVVGELTSRDDSKVAIPSDWLVCGKSYTVHESEPAKGYYYSSEDQHFTVPSTVEEAKQVDKAEFTITVEDPQIYIDVAKVDNKTKEYVGGATLGLYDSETSTTPLVTWKSSADEPHRISDDLTLTAGKTYYVRELSVDGLDGYYLNEAALPIVIPTNLDNAQNPVLSFDFVNQPIYWHVKKVDMEGNVLTTSPNGSYFTLEVYDTQETLDNPSDDGTPIATLCTNDPTYKAKGYFDMDEYIKQGLVKGGHHYRIHEAEAADGYRLAEDVVVQISASANTDTIVSSVEDDEIRIYLRKVDDEENTLTTVDTIDGEQGFVLTIYDEDTGDEVFTIDTSDEEYKKNGYVDVSKYLSASKNYVVKETVQPRGYYKAKDVSFTVDSFADDGSNETLKYEDITVNGKKAKVGMITMIDPKIHVQFRKENNIGDVIYGVDGKGFEFQIFDTRGTDDTSDDIVVGTIDTLNDPHNESGYIEIGQYLQEATKYRIHESYAPSGYSYSKQDVYVTTPGYYNESEGNVQNVVIQFD